MRCIGCEAQELPLYRCEKIYSYPKIIHDRCKIKRGSEFSANLNSSGVTIFKPVDSLISRIFHKHRVVLYGVRQGGNARFWPAHVGIWLTPGVNSEALESLHIEKAFRFKADVIIMFSGAVGFCRAWPGGQAKCSGIWWLIRGKGFWLFLGNCTALVRAF